MKRVRVTKSIAYTNMTMFNTFRKDIILTSRVSNRNYICERGLKKKERKKEKKKKERKKEKK